MPVRQGKYLAGVMTIAAMGAGVAAAPAAHAEWNVRVVHEGQSIQVAVDSAAPGDTVYVMPGAYRESIQINKKLTLRGAGAGQVVIKPAATPSSGAPGQAPSTGTSAQAPSTGTSAQAPSTGTSAQMPATGVSGQASSTGPSVQKPAAGSAAQKPAIGTSAQKPAAGSAAQKPAIGTSAQKPAAGSAAQKPAIGTSAQKPAAGSAAQKPAAGAVKKPAAKAAGTAAACAAAGNGICVTGTAQQPVQEVRIESLAIQGFAADGIHASDTDRMAVEHVTVQENGRYGISQEMSTRAVISHNHVTDNTQQGIFLANSATKEAGALDTKGTVVSDNTLSGNRIGLTVRRVRAMDIQDNVVTGNCGGVFVVGDENIPRAGDLDIRNNEITANNKFCAANDRLPFIQGTGILLTGTEDARVTANQVRDNVGTSPLSGGIVLYPSMMGAPNVRNQVTGNVLSGNGPSDLADRDSTGSANTFTTNTCKVSEPAGRC
jgi:Right handed beta helix region